jgi:hypothetical protein
MRTINKAAEADIQKFSEYYYTFSLAIFSKYWSKEAATDDAIRDYLEQQTLTLNVCNIDEIPHQDAKFASLYATAASSFLTGLFAYLALRDEGYTLDSVTCLSFRIFAVEFVICDILLDDFFPTSTPAYYLSSGIRATIPAVAGLYALNSLIEERKTGQNTNVKVAPSKKKEKEGEKKEKFPYVWIKIPKDEKGKEIPNVWKKKDFER